MMDAMEEHAARCILSLYTRHAEITGGMLHVQIDDENLEDVFWAEPFTDFLLELHERDPLPIEREIVRVMQQLSTDQRERAIRLARGVEGSVYDAWYRASNEWGPMDDSDLLPFTESE